MSLFPHLLPRSERWSKRRRARGASAALLAGLILVSGVSASGFFQPTAAQAVTLGPGNWFGGNVGAGAFHHSNGTLVYCAELGRATVMGGNPAMNDRASLPAYSVGSFTISGSTFADIDVPALSGAKFKQLSFVLAHYGQTSSDSQAAAVQIAIWQLRSSGASTGYQSVLSYMKNGVGASVAARANEMISAAQNASDASEAPDDPRINIGNTPYVGTVIVDPGTTKLTLTNGIFSSTGTETITFSPATSSVKQVAFQGQPPADLESWERHYRVTVNGTYKYQVSGGHVNYGRPGGSLDQGLVNAAKKEMKTGRYDAAYIDPDTIWSPTLNTEVPSQIVKKGEKFSDIVTFGVAEDSNPWRTAFNSSGEHVYAPINAHGTLYGPFLSDPAKNPQTTPPTGAPVAAKSTISTTAAKGPGRYKVESTDVSRETGYYTWVWNIEFEDQVASVQSPPDGDSSLPSGYFFTDGFGQLTEGQLTPTELSITTDLKDTQVTLSDLTLQDVVTPKLVEGGWLHGDNGRLPVQVRLTAYGQKGKVERQSTPPPKAKQIATTLVEINAPTKGHKSPEMTISIADFQRFDGGTVQACIVDEDQPVEFQGFVLETCDDYGAPAEVFSFQKPIITTKAQNQGSMGDLFNDTAIVSGGDLPDGATIGATAYLRPIAGDFKYDSNWEAVLDSDGEPRVWTQEEIDAIASDELCEVQPVATTDRIPVRGQGEFKLPAVRAGSEGSGIDWVEDTQIPNPDTDEPLEWSRGHCGDVNEYTELPRPEVTTQVHLPKAGPNNINFDNIIVSKLTVSNDSDYRYEAVVDAYFTNNASSKPDCSVNEKVWTSKNVKVPGSGTYQTNSYRISNVVKGDASSGRLDHVEKLIRINKASGDREVIVQSECGAASESTVLRSPLALTGGSSLGLIGITAVILLILGGAVGMFNRRRYLTTVREAVETDTPLESRLEN